MTAKCGCDSIVMMMRTVKMVNDVDDGNQKVPEVGEECIHSGKVIGLKGELV